MGYASFKFHECNYVATGPAQPSVQITSASLRHPPPPEYHRSIGSDEAPHDAMCASFQPPVDQAHNKLQRVMYLAYEASTRLSSERRTDNHILGFKQISVHCGVFLSFSFFYSGLAGWPQDTWPPLELVLTELVMRARGLQENTYPYTQLPNYEGQLRLFSSNQGGRRS